MKPYLTAKQYKELLTHLCVVHTTNEQKNDHITKWFDENEILHEARALKTGDYCFKITAAPEYGFPVDTYFTDELFVERKNSLGELAGSINDEAFHYELKRSQNIKHKYLLVEQPGGWEDLLNGNYRSQYNAKSFWGTMNTFMVKYDLKVMFLKKERMGAAIYAICKSVLDGYVLKQGG